MASKQLSKMMFLCTDNQYMHIKSGKGPQVMVKQSRKTISVSLVSPLSHLKQLKMRSLKMYLYTGICKYI